MNNCKLYNLNQSLLFLLFRSFPSFPFFSFSLITSITTGLMFLNFSPYETGKDLT